MKMRFAALLLSGGISMVLMSCALSAEVQRPDSDVIGEALMDDQGVLKIKLFPPVHKDHSEIVSTPGDEYYAYYLCQARGISKGGTAPFLKAYGSVFMAADGEIQVNLNYSPSAFLSGSKRQEVVNKNDERYKYYLKRYPNMKPGDKFPIIADKLAACE